MSSIEISLQQLRGMIGLTVRYQGEHCLVVEVLEDSTSLVLQSQEYQATIQADQYGDPRRRVPQTYTIPVLSAQRDELHPEFLSLELVE